MKALVYRLHRLLFVRKAMYRVNRALYSLALRGIGILNYEDSRSSGEARFLASLFRKRKGGVVFDVGANVGDYSDSVAALDPTARIFAFEPHPKTFAKLSCSAAARGYEAINSALGASTGRMMLFDYRENDGSQHASLFKSVIEDLHSAESVGTEVGIGTLDDFAAARGIREAVLLKIDTEGYEFAVLSGAADLVRTGRVEVIHFEFNEMNVASRVFMKDFFDLLPQYRFYRMLPDGLVEFRGYDAAACEIFAYQNIVAIRSDSNLADSL